MPSFLTRRAALVFAATLLTIPAVAQQPRPNQLPPPGPPQAQPQRPGGPQAPAAQAPAQAPIKPYQPVAFKMPTPSTDPGFEAFRKQLADVAKRKDRNALAKLVVSLESLRVDAEISMNEKQVEAARLRGDEDAVRALIRRGIELKQSKLGLRAALERP